MSLNLEEKAKELLNQVANSLYDRDSSKLGTLFFNANEISIVERFLRDLLLENDLQKINDLIL